MAREPYGSWPSPIDATMVARGSSRIAEVRVDRNNLYWIESRPAEGGRHAIMRLRPNGSLDEVLPRDFNARSRVHEYGGGHYTVRDGVVWFANFDDQRLYRIGPSGRPAPITPEAPRGVSVRYADADVTPDGRWLVCVRETHPRDGGPDDVVNDLVAVPADGDGNISVLTQGRDFYGAPRVNADGTRLAWIAWDHPDMPWDANSLHVAVLDVDTDRVMLGDRERVAGGEDESVAEPAWSPDGVLHAMSDRSGWWNLWRFPELGPDRYGGEPVHDTEAEFARPQWVFRPPRYGFLDDGRIACTWFDEGFDRIGALDPDSGEVETLDVLELTSVDALATDGGRVVAAGRTLQDLPALHQLNTASGIHRILHDPNDLDLDAGWFPQAEHVTYMTGDDELAHAIVYPPRNPDIDEPDDGQPPLVVFTHGGPTSHVAAGLDLEIAYFTSRGFVVVDVNYRGSTGYGRAYREKLYGRWGEVDVEDAVQAARHLADRGEADPGKMAIRGGSAGGYTTLCALAFRDVFSAGASYYGVADVRLLDEETHKFESRYMERLIPTDEFEARSPIHHTDGFSAPMIVFQGLEDEIVPPDQAKELVGALDRKGLPHAYVTFEGEQHGFRKQDSIVTALESEFSFYGWVFRFEPADDLPKVKIKNARKR